MSESSAFFHRQCCSECGTVMDSGDAAMARGNLHLDRALRRATWKGQPVPLTRQQFGIVELLAHREGRAVQKWAFYANGILNEDSENNTLDVQLCRIRKAFRAVDPEFEQIETVRAQGLMWRRGALCNQAI